MNQTGARSASKWSRRTCWRCVLTSSDSSFILPARRLTINELLASIVEAVDTAPSFARTVRLSAAARRIGQLIVSRTSGSCCRPGARIP
jgi:hypothetical protein